MIGSLARSCLERPRLAWAAIFFATALALAGTLRLETAVGYRALLGAGHPAIAQLDALSARFGGGLSLAAVWGCAEGAPCESALDPLPLEMAYQVAKTMRALPDVVRVDSPATSPLWVAPPLGLPERRFLVDPATGSTAKDLDALRAAAVQDEAWVGQILSPDASAAAIVLHLRDSGSDSGVAVVATLRAALARYESEGFRFGLVGGPVEFVVAGKELSAAAAQMIPAMVLLTGLVLWAMFRRPGPALASLACVGVALLWTLGLQGWLGWPQTSLSQALAPLVLVIGVCDAIHLLSAYGAQLGSGTAGAASRKAAMRRAIDAVALPCTYTTVTTAVGFASFAVAELESVTRFGWIAGWGVVAALLLSFSALPVLVAWLPAGWMRSDPASAFWSRRLAQLGAFPRRAAPLVIAAGGALLLLAVWGVPRVETEARFENLYGEQSLVVQWVRYAERVLRSAETLEIAVDLPGGQDPTDPGPLAALAAAERSVATPPLGPALSVLAPIRTARRLAELFAAGLGPELTPERASQMARLVRRREPALFGHFVDRERPGFRLSVQAGKLPQRELREVLQSVEASLRAALPAGYRVALGGPLATVSRMLDALRAAQLTSFALALALVLALVAVLLRSVPLALLAAVPTALPVATTLGAMGGLGIGLDVGSAMVATVVVGLAVDDAIHFLVVYRRERSAGRPVESAVSTTLQQVGQALVSSTLALGFGFSALALSPWASVARFGGVAAVAVIGALLAALVLLPALLFVLRPANERGEPT